MRLRVAASEIQPRFYVVATATVGAGMLLVAGAGTGRIGCSHPALSQERGIENSDQPQSRHTRISGEGVMGGWLRVRGLLRYNRISAGIRERAADWHFGQTMATIPLIDETAKYQHNIYNRGEPKCNRISRQFSTESVKLYEFA